MSCGEDEMAARSSSAVTLIGSGIVSRIARSGDIGLNRGSDTVKASITSHMAVRGVESDDEMSRRSRRPRPGSNLRTHGRGRAQGHPPHLRATTISGQATLPSSEERCASPLRSQPKVRVIPNPDVRALPHFLISGSSRRARWPAPWWIGFRMTAFRFGRSG